MMLRLLLPLLLAKVADGAGCSGDFEFGNAVNVVTLFAVVIILLTIVVHGVSDRIDKAVEKHEHVKEIVQEVYKEMGNVGLTAFLVFAASMMNASDGVSEWIEKELGHTPAQQRHVFEILHMALFCSMLLYIFSIVLLMLVCRQAKKRFLALEKDYTPGHTQKYTALETVHGKKPAWKKAYKTAEHREAERFHLFNVIRTHFIRQHTLPDDFVFAEFMGIQLDALIVRLARIHFTTWLVVLGILLVNWLRYVFVGGVSIRAKEGSESGGKDSALSPYAFITPVGVALGIFLLIIRWKVRTIYSVVVKEQVEDLLKQREPTNRRQSLATFARRLSIKPGGSSGLSSPPLSPQPEEEDEARDSTPPSPRGRNSVQPAQPRAVKAFEEDGNQDEVRTTGCLCCKRKDTVHASMFWFGRPVFIEICLQLVFLFFSWYLGVCIYFISIGYVYFLLVALLPLLSFFLFPDILSRLTVVSHVGDINAKGDDIVAHLLEQKQAREKAALAEEEGDNGAPRDIQISPLPVPLAQISPRDNAALLTIRSMGTE